MADAGMLRFHVPEPEVRPGGTPDFSNVPIPKAGSAPRLRQAPFSPSLYGEKCPAGQ